MPSEFSACLYNQVVLCQAYIAEREEKEDVTEIIVNAGLFKNREVKLLAVKGTEVL